MVVLPIRSLASTLKALYCFRGFDTANQVLGEVRHPLRALGRHALGALSVVTAACIVTDFAYGRHLFPTRRGWPLL